MSDEKEPETAEGFYSRQIRRILDFRVNRINKDETDGLSKIAELRLKVAEGHEFEMGIKGDFWKERVLPLLQEQCDASLRPWVPGGAEGAPFNKDEINARYFASSGAARVVGVLLSRIRRSIEEGKAAAVELAHEEKRLELLRGQRQKIQK